RHYRGPMPGRRWLRGVGVQQWHWTTSGTVRDYAFQEIYSYDWQGRRIGKSYCDADAGAVAYDNDRYVCQANNANTLSCGITGMPCGKNGGMTYDYDGPN